MKKNKRHLYKRLPKYALGTMKPIDLGYQPGRGIGSTKFQTEQNVSLEPETQAIRKSALPNALGYVTQQSPYITEIIKSGNKTATTAGTTATSTASSATQNSSFLAPSLQNLSGSALTQQVKLFANTPLKLTNPLEEALNFGSTTMNGTKNLIGSGASSFGSGLSSGIGATASSSLGSTGTSLASTGLGGLGETNGAAFFGNSGLKIGGEAAKTATRSTLGTAMGAVGTALGAYTMANQIAGFGDHRSAPDMMANVGRAQNTTEYGNQYTTYNGVNAGQELAYEKANARAKQLGFGMNSIGTGASLGGMLGSLGALGSIGGPLGTALGAGVGLLLGGLGSLFGWGDNSEEIERITRLTNDNLAMYNREQESVARSKDVAAEFNDRQSVGSAAEGKNAYGPMNAKKGDDINTPKVLFDVNAENNISVGIPTSKLMPGETVFDKESLNWAVVPGKGNKDNVYSSVRPGDSNVVLTKKEGLSKIGAAVLKSNAPEDLKRWQLNELEKKQAALQESENNQNNMRNYKCGKLPGYWKGTDYLMSAIPHLAALGSSWNQYNRAKYADMPDYPTIVDSDANTKAINILGSRRFNPEPILNMLNDQHRHALYELHRTPGLTAGGQAIAMANQNIKTSRAKAEALAQADEINNRYTADYANALANYGKWMSEMMTNNNYARAAFKQQQNAAKEGWMAQYQKNGLTALADLASDVMGVRQFNRSEDYQNRMLDLYDRQVKNDTYNAKAALIAAQQAREDRQAARSQSLSGAINAYDAIRNAYNLYPGYMPFGLIRFGKGKNAAIRSNDGGYQFEEIQPKSLFGSRDRYSTKSITPQGDTIYYDPTDAGFLGLSPKEYIRKKNGKASKGYLNAKNRHEKLLKDADVSSGSALEWIFDMFKR